MKKYVKVTDFSKLVNQNYFKTVFCRNERVRDKISLIRWVYFCLLEVVFGQELLENFVTTASLSGCPEEPDEEKNFGFPDQLNSHIPNGIFTNIFRKQLIQILYYKYYLQYLFISPVSGIAENKDRDTIDVTRIRFRFNKSLLGLVIAFRRVYLFTALALNILIDLGVYIITDDISITLLCAVSIEGFRRIFKL